MTLESYSELAVRVCKIYNCGRDMVFRGNQLITPKTLKPSFRAGKSYDYATHKEDIPM